MTVTIILYILRTIAALMLPVAAFVYVRTKFSGNIRNFFDGAAVYLIFYCLIYAVLSTYLELFTNVFAKIESSTVLSCVNVAIETFCVAVGYLIWFKAAVKKQNDNSVGLMAGVGFSSFMMLFSYAFPSVVNIVIAVMTVKKPNAEILSVFEENAYQVSTATSSLLFFDLLEMIFLFILEISVATVFYRVLRCENRRIWLLAAVVLRIAAHTVIRLGSLLDRAVIVIILAVITVTTAGVVYSLIKPFMRKNEE